MSSRRTRDRWTLRVRTAFGDARRRFIALVALVTLVVATIAAGKAYLWCVPLQRAMADCCCASGHDDAAGREQPTIARACCCDVQAVGALPAVRELPAGAELPPAVVAYSVMPPAPVVPARTRVLRPAFPPSRPLRHGLTRAGPRFASDTCIRLQTFLC